MKNWYDELNILNIYNKHLKHFCEIGETILFKSWKVEHRTLYNIYTLNTKTETKHKLYCNINLYFYTISIIDNYI